MAIIKKIAYLFAFIGISLLLSIIFIRPRGTFEELVLKEFKGKEEQNLFNEVEIQKITKDTGVSIRNDNDTEKINHALDEFSKLKLVQFNGNLPADKNIQYLIYFSNDVTDEEMTIIVYDNNFLMISLESLSNKDKNDTSDILQIERQKRRYRILNNDMVMIDNLFESLNNIVK